MGDHCRSHQLIRLLAMWKPFAPGTIIKHYQDNQTHKKYAIKDQVWNAEPVLDKKKTKIDPQGHIEHQPE